MKVLTVAFLLPTISLAFVVPNAPSRSTSFQSYASRRAFVADAAAGMSLLLFAPQSALAKEEAIPATRENVKKAFDDLRYELNGGDGGVARMQRAIDAGDWEGLMDITKTYDQILRKGRIGRIKSFLSDKEKSITTLSANAITFDLIGINRNARPGQENAAEASRYLDELRTDLQLVIDKERLVAYAD